VGPLRGVGSPATALHQKVTPVTMWWMESSRTCSWNSVESNHGALWASGSKRPFAVYRSAEDYRVFRIQLVFILLAL